MQKLMSSSMLFSLAHVPAKRWSTLRAARFHVYDPLLIPPGVVFGRSPTTLPSPALPSPSLPSPGRRSNFGRQVGEESNMLSSLLACAGLLTGPRIALCKGSYPAHPLVLSQTIEALAAGKKNGLACTPAESEELEEVISMLEAQSPTEAPAQSALLDGAWRLVYTSTQGGSAGKLGPFVGKVQQVFDYPSGTYFNEVALRGVRAKLDAHWEVLDPSSWKVVFDRISLFVLGVRVVSKPFPPSQNGVWRMTYLDENMRILRASGSSSPETENVYVLARSSS